MRDEISDIKLNKYINKIDIVKKKYDVLVRGNSFHYIMDIQLCFNKPYNELKNVYNKTGYLSKYFGIIINMYLNLWIKKTHFNQI